MSHGNWRVLADGPDEGAVLTVDFGPGRPEANFADLVALLPGDTLVWESTFGPVRDPVADTDPDACVERWVAGVRSAGLRVRGVLGYCAGAALAVRAAAALRAAGLGEPAVVLLDPTGVDGELVRDQFASSVGAYAELLPEETCREALDAVTAATAGLGPDLGRVPAPVLAEVVTAVQGRYDALVTAVCRELGTGDATRQDFSDRFGSYLAYLATAGRAAGALGPAGAGPAGAAGAPGPVRPTVLVSRSHPPPPPYDRVDRRFPVPRAGLLADPAVAGAVAEAIGPDGAGRHSSTSVLTTPETKEAR